MVEQQLAKLRSKILIRAFRPYGHGYSWMIEWSIADDVWRSTLSGPWRHEDEGGCVREVMTSSSLLDLLDEVERRSNSTATYKEALSEVSELLDAIG